jgi:hypothetical protein
VWSKPSQPLALPAIGLVLVQAGTPRLVRRSDLPDGSPLPRGGAALVTPPATWPESLPLDRFAACDDEDWID